MDAAATEDAVAHIARGDVPWLRARLHAEPPAFPRRPTSGDYDLAPELQRHAANDLLLAAVLLPIVLRPEPMVLFTQRSTQLSRHAGQVSFPGGRSQDGDVSLTETALRETREETGIEPAFVTVAGFLNTYETGTGYAVLPVVGLLNDGFALVPDANEVAQIFEVPLAFLMDRGNLKHEEREWKGVMRRIYSFTYGPHYIWGATAAMVVGFTERLRA